MNVSFEKITAGPASRGRTIPALPRANTQRGSLRLSASAPLERGKLAQALLNIFQAVSVTLFVGSVAASIPLALFLLFFGKF